MCAKYAFIVDVTKLHQSDILQYRATPVLCITLTIEVYCGFYYDSTVTT